MFRRMKIILTLVLTVSFLPLGKARAVPPMPLSVYGTVKIAGEFVPEGTEVSAWCGGVSYVQTTTFTYEEGSWYSMDIPGDDPDTEVKDGCDEGETVSFTVAEQNADLNTIWSSRIMEFNLTTDQIGFVDSDPPVWEDIGGLNPFPLPVGDWEGYRKGDQQSKSEDKVVFIPLLGGRP